MIEHNMSGLSGLSEQDLSAQLSELYAPCCTTDLPDLVDNEALLEMMMEAAKKIYKEGALPEGLINQEVTTAIASKLWEAIEEGYGMNIAEVDFDSEDGRVLQALQENTWHFAGAKNYTQLRQIGNALINEEGGLRSEREFIQEALKINSRMSKHYLTVEYNLAAGNAQMAAKWVDIQATKELFPFLQFDAVMDGNTSEICAPLDGKIYRVDHPFWDQYYPKNHFRCRSTVRKLSYGVESAPSAPATDIPELFRSNMAKQGLAFPEGHPYFVDLPEEVRLKTTTLINNDRP